MPTAEKHCLFCRRDEQVTPLVVLTFQGGALHLCPQHLPILIHDPQRLVGLLPGAETLEPAEHHD
jgi:hypothetical protein